MGTLSGCLRLAGCMLALGATLMSQGASAADYPSRPVMMMVPTPPAAVGRHRPRRGGARVQAAGPAGAGGKPGRRQRRTGRAESAVGPRRRLLPVQGSPNRLILAPLANASVKLKSEDFLLVQMIGLAPLVIVARKDLPANNADELVKLARSRAATQPLSFGSVGVGSLHHVLGEHMARTIGAEMMHVPYKGGAPLMQDMGGGQVDFAILPLAQRHVALAEQGRVKLLGTLSPRRSALPALAAVPSVNEGELLKGFNFTTWTGYFVKRDTPADVVARLHAALNAAMQDAEVKRGLETQNIEVSAPMTPAEADAMYQAETVRFREISSHVKLADAP